MEHLHRRIVSLMDDPDWSFVFPSEISARFWRHTLLRRGDCEAVLAGRFLSWDRFKEIAFGLSEARRPVNGVIRTLYSVRLAEENRTAPFLTRLLPGGEGGGTGELTRILPRLHALVPSVADHSWPLATDLVELYRRYGEFLDRHSLFEPSSLEPSLENLNHDYLLIAPNALEDFTAYRRWIEDHPRIEIFNHAPKNKPQITVYDNERLEAAALFRSIRKLLEEGTSPREIVITLPDIEHKRRFIEEAAHRFEIPLIFRTGRRLTEFSGVRLFRLLYEAAGDSFEIAKFRNLLLNAAIPWKQRDKLRRLLIDGAENYVLRNWRDTDGSHGWEEQLRLAGKNESLDIYRRLSGGIRGVVDAPGFSEIAVRLQAFIGVFLDTARWQQESPVQLMAFQRALEILNDFAAAEEQFPELKASSAYTVWIAALEEANYVEQQGAEGIEVYPYRVAAGLFPKHHFIPFLTQDSSRVVWDRGFPLNEAQREEAEIRDDDVSDIYLRLYTDSGSDVTASCALQGYSGPGLAPGLFVDNKGVCRPSEEKHDHDPEQADELFFRGTLPSLPRTARWQQRGFTEFLATGALGHTSDLMEKPITHAGLAEAVGNRYFNAPRKQGITPTDLDAFSACPFAFLFTTPLGLEEPEYQPLIRDHRLEGTVLHKVLELFIGSLPSGRFLAAQIAEYRDRIPALLAEHAGSLRGPLPVKPAWTASLTQMAEQLTLFPEAEKQLFDNYASAGAEKSLTATIDGVPVSGRIDRISRGTAGELLVVDYKKGFRFNRQQLGSEGGAPSTMQLPFYVLLLEAMGTYQEGADLTTAYYVVSEGKYRILSSTLDMPGRTKPAVSEKGFEDLKRITREKLAGMQRRIRAGDFRTDPDECACSLRSLCRSRYVVRGEQ